MKIKSLLPDVVFWPVYTDFNCNEWNESMKYEYAEQAGKVGGKVMYVNSYCKDRDGDEIARGGSVLFHDGVIVKEIPSGKEDVLVVEV
jgi:N-carbamoylputrescine amidase